MHSSRCAFPIDCTFGTYLNWYQIKKVHFQVKRLSDRKDMEAYFCHHLSNNYVDLSDLYVVLSDLYVDLSEFYFDLSLIHLLENKSSKRAFAQLMPYN